MCMKYNNLIDLLKEVSVIRAKESFVNEISSGEIVTYYQFYELAEKRAQFMKQCGLKDSDKVGLMYINSLEFMINFFAVLINFAIVVPINPQLKDRELKYIIEDANLRYIVTDANKCDRIRKLTTVIKSNYCDKKIGFVEINEHTADLRDDNLGNDTALIMYTSGTTGKAKGVILTHANLLCEMENIKEAHELTTNDKVLCILPWFHINGLVITMLTPLLVGHEIVIAEKFSRSNFWKWVDDYQITWFSGVPTIYSYLLTDKSYSRHKSLRFARSASSALPVSVLKEFERRYHVPVIESYGMTEGGSQLTANPVPPGIRKAGSVGIPYGVELRVVNDENMVCKNGELGEIQFCGNSITKGYYKKIKETEQSFTDKWLKTGDIGYIDDEGYLFLCGRKKELINRGGEKISPKEIEEVLYQYKGVQIAVAVGIMDELYGEEIIAFCVCDHYTALSEEELIVFCKKYLADYKVPKKIIFLDELPVGENGKVQRMKLVEEFGRGEKL